MLIATLLAVCAFGTPLRGADLDVDGWRMFDRRVGMFVHWGVYSVGGFHEQEQMRLGVSRADYAKYAERFAAEKFDAEKFVDAAELLGADYIVFTSKHHDGFCLWDTKTTPFNVMNTPAKRDVVVELAAACRRRGMKFGLYYSNPDWHHPNGYNPRSTHQVPPEAGDRTDIEALKTFVKAQVTELLSNYGEICCLFWDIPSKFDAPEMNSLVRRLQPNIRIDDRGWGDDGDYTTPERGIPDGAAFVRPTEACDSVGARSWGFRLNEDYRTLGYTSRSIDHILTMGGNFLLNVGPKPDGTIPDEALSLLKRTGDWYRKVRESYREVTTEPWLAVRDNVMVTRRGRTVYVHCPKGLLSTGLDLMPIAERPVKATLLNTGVSVDWDMTCIPNHVPDTKAYLHLKNLPADDLANESAVIRLDFDCVPEAVLLEEKNVRMVRYGEFVRLVFTAPGKGGAFALGGDRDVLSGRFDAAGKLVTNVSRDLRSSFANERGTRVFAVDVPFDAIPRLAGDEGAFLASFRAPGDSVQGGTLLRLASQATTVDYFKNPMDMKDDLLPCSAADSQGLRWEEKGGAVAAGFRLTNANASGDLRFRNGKVYGSKDGRVVMPSVPVSVLVSLKVKGTGRFRLAFESPESTYASAPFAVNAADDWQTVHFSFVPKASAARSSILPVLLLAPGGDLVVDDLEMRFLDRGVME